MIFQHKLISSVIALLFVDFLPMLIYVLVQCGIVAAEIEADYMWGLIHPSLLNGEGGYYLTSLSSAVLALKNFKNMQGSLSDQQQVPELILLYMKMYGDLLNFFIYENPVWYYFDEIMFQLSDGSTNPGGYGGVSESCDPGWTEGLHHLEDTSCPTQHEHKGCL